MRKIITFLTLLLVIISSSFLNVKAKSNGYLDRIDYYEITIDPNKDGTLDMEFNIIWTVLDSTTDGPLTWVKIGIPNKYASNIQATTSNISKISYYSDSGSYIKIDLNREYFAGETLEIGFTYIQARMYMLKGSDCYYNYKPGWFDEIPVTSAVVKWNKSGIIDSNYMTLEGDYYIWSNALNPGETLDINIKYDQSYFRVLNPDLQYTDAYLTTKDIVAIIIIVCVFAVSITVLIISIVSQQDPYLHERGFVGRSYYFHRRRYYHAGYYSTGRKIRKPVTVNSSGFRGSNGSSCAYACACACAGGGRAGCSMKDFYKHPKLEQIKKAIEKHPIK